MAGDRQRQGILDLWPEVNVDPDPLLLTLFLSLYLFYFSQSKSIKISSLNFLFSFFIFFFLLPYLIFNEFFFLLSLDFSIRIANSKYLFTKTFKWSLINIY